MNEIVRWGILGTGQIACDFAQGLSQVASAELRAVASRSESRAADFASKFGEVRPYAAYDELVASDDLDVIYIATPNHRHHDDCHLCLDAGKGILCEKPFALNHELANRVIEKAQRKKLFCMEAMWMRCMPLVQKAKTAVSQGMIGEPRMLVADFGYPVPLSTSNRYYSLELGGGSLMDRGVYVVNLAHLLLGAPETVNGQANMSETGVDEQAAIVLGYKSGAIASLTCSMTHRTSNIAVLYGTEGRISLHAPFFRPHRMTFEQGATDVPPHDPIAALPDGGMKSALKLQLKTTLQSLYRRAEPFLPQKLANKGQTWTDLKVGNGYHYEAAEVTQCLQRQQTESARMPLSETLEVMQTLDQLRNSWGIKFPGDGPDPGT